jgi:dephospho-CoA kinase
MQTAEVIMRLKKHLVRLFDGIVLKRDKLAEIVFNDPEKLQQLNGIVHLRLSDILNNGFWTIKSFQL